MSFCSREVKHSRIRAILVRICYFHKTTPFFHFLQISSSSRPAWHREDGNTSFTLSNFSLASYSNEPCAAAEAFLAGSPRAAVAEDLAAAPTRHPRCRQPPPRRLQHQLALPWRPSPRGRVARNVLTPGKTINPERSEREMAGKWAAAFLLPAELPAFWGPAIFPPASAPLPFPKLCSPASRWKRLTGHEHTQGLEEESQNQGPNPETHLATEHERTKWETAGSPWPGSPEGSGGGRAGSGSPAQPLLRALSWERSQMCYTANPHLLSGSSGLAPSCKLLAA